VVPTLQPQRLLIIWRRDSKSFTAHQRHLLRSGFYFGECSCQFIPIKIKKLQRNWHGNFTKNSPDVGVECSNEHVTKSGAEAFLNVIKIILDYWQSLSQLAYFVLLHAALA
jgi:hypothetical protein